MHKAGEGSWDRSVFGSSLLLLLHDLCSVESDWNLALDHPWLALSLVNFVFDSLARQHAELHLNPVQHRLVRALTSHVIVVFICVLNEGARLLIDCIVGQVHA